MSWSRLWTVILNKTEFVSFGICHYCYHAFVIVVPFAGEPAAKNDNLRDAFGDVGDRDIEVQTCLDVFRLRYRLEDEARLWVVGLAEVHPTGPGGPPWAVQQVAPEVRHPFYVDAVDSHPDPAVQHAVSTSVLLGVGPFATWFSGRF